MIADTLDLLLRANVAASTAIVAVALLRDRARTHLGAQAAYRLWAIPAVAALASLIPMPQGAATARPIMIDAATVLAAATSPEAGSAWLAIVAAGWASGAFAFAAMLVLRQLKFATALRGGRPDMIDGAPVIRAPRPDIGPAVVAGAIVIPEDFERRFTAAEQAAVLAHEAQHLARGDVLANGLAAAVQCVCWFNPIVHLAARWMRVDQEFACDAAVIAARPGLRRPYAEALLKTQMAALPPLGCAWQARGVPALRERIRLLKQRAPGRARRIGGALVLAALTFGGGYAAWATQPAPTEATVVQPDWSSRPTGADLVRLYPADAIARGLGGMVLMQCRVERGGDLTDCGILREGPQGAGFGAAALQMAPLFRMKPMSRNGKPVAGGVVRIPIRFLVPEAKVAAS
jgi:TonB family protein